MAVKISKRTVDNVEPSATTTFLWDTDEKGFGLRVTPTGARSYVYQYRLGGRETTARRHTIGKHGSPWTPEEARREARRLALAVGTGVDPIEADRERRRVAVDLSFEGYVNLFHGRYLAPRWKQPEAARSTLLRHAVPHFRKVPLPQIRRADISRLFDGMESTPAAAKFLHSVLRKMFRWAVERGDLERSPMDGAQSVPAVPSRERVLTDAELVQVWRGSMALKPAIGTFYRLLILTGARRSEVAGLKWDELSRHERLWTLPTARSKNGTTYLAPLSTQSVALLDELAGGTDWPGTGLIFTSNSVTPISGFGQFKARLDHAIASLDAQQDDAVMIPLTPWRVHDLRRTLATGLQRLGVRFEVTEAVLNHLSGSRSGVAGVYQRHHWKHEKTEALQAWADHVERLVR